MGNEDFGFNPKGSNSMVGSDDDEVQMPSIISSAPDLVNESTPSNNVSPKFFGGRSRTDQISSSMKHVSMRDDAPKFFNDAMRESEPHTNEASGSSFNFGKVAKIIGISLGAAAIITVAIIAVIFLTRPYADGMKPDDVKEILTNEKIDLVGSFEESIMATAKTKISLSDLFGYSKNDAVLTGLKDGLSNYKQVYEEISEYEAVQYREDTVEYFENAKTKMSEMIPKYEGIVERYEKLYESAYGSNFEETLASMQNINESDRTSIRNYLKFRSMDASYKAMNCSVEQRTTPGTDCYIAKNELKDFEEQVDGGFDLRSVIFASNSAEFIEGDQLVRKDLRAILYAIDDKALEGDEDE